MKYNLAEGKEQSAYVLGYKPKSEKLVWMNPEKFLKIAPLRFPDSGSLRDLTEKMKAGKKLDALWFDVDVKTRRVSQHEGRHRATVAKQLGIEKVPVILYAKKGYEWTSKRMLPKIENIIGR